MQSYRPVGVSPTSNVSSDDESSAKAYRNYLYTSDDDGSKDYEIEGIGTIMTKWSNLPWFNGSVGRKFKERLKKDKDSTWYILNYSPYGLARSGEAVKIIIDAAKDSNVKIKWAFQTPNFVYENNFSQLLMSFLPTILVANQQFVVNKQYIYDYQCVSFNTIRATINNAVPGARNNIHIYASKAPTFYFAWISIPNKTQPDLDATNFTAPTGTFGFVTLYGHLSPYEDSRPAIYFDNSQTKGEMPLLNFYTASTVRFFEKGLKPPLIPDRGPANPPYLIPLTTDKDWSDSRSKCQN
jgi:hypothetical protein